MEKLINNLILFVLAVSTLIQVLNWLGFLPQKIRKFLKLNQSQDTLEVLEEMGVDIKRYQRQNAVIGIPIDFPEDIEKDTEEKLKELMLNINVSVGRNRGTALNYYIDLIGYTCDSKYAKSYAKLLSTYWAKAVAEGTVNNPCFDFIVTPKNGSPILGYEFAQLLGKPFVLHEDSERFASRKDDMRKKFDCGKVIEKGKTALIVDDSTTGGRMVMDTISDLRKYGFKIKTCLVVFEPQIKDARKKLNNEGVQLISIVQTHKKTGKS